MSARPRVVVTGVAGFIGSNLADRLIAEGYEVAGIDDLSFGLREQVPDGVEFHRLDIRDDAVLDVLHAGDVVFHLAAKNCISDCQDDPVTTVAINVLGAVALFEAARRAGVAKVVYAESASVYEGVTTMPTAEETIAPESFYAVSKAASAAFADAYRRFHGMRLTGLRYFNVYGPRQDYRRSVPPVMSAFMLALLDGRPPVIYGTGNKRRDFVHVDDINDFHLSCITDAATDGRVFNLGSGRSTSVREIYEAVARIVGSTTPPRFEVDLPGEAQETLADISAARALGWTPRMDLDAGLRGLLEYFREHVLGARA